MVPAFRCAKCGSLAVSRPAARCACGCAAFDLIHVRRAELVLPVESHEHDARYTVFDLMGAREAGVIVGFVAGVILAGVVVGMVILRGLNAGS